MLERIGGPKDDGGITPELVGWSGDGGDQPTFRPERFIDPWKGLAALGRSLDVDTTHNDGALEMGDDGCPNDATPDRADPPLH